jgi:uncharacterized membrane protein YciS (DUF1049 family)
VSAFAFIAIIVGVFFAAGIAVGMLAVVALPILRYSLQGRRARRRLTQQRDWYDDGRPPRWPGR